jgi:pyruvate/2-oxoglutarate/acetoin dehydrogenase E1 component
VGAEVVRQVTERGFNLLQRTPKVLGGRDLPIPFAKPLENAVVPHVDDIVQAVCGLVFDGGGDSRGTT